MMLILLFFEKKLVNLRVVKPEILITGINFLKEVNLKKLKILRVQYFKKKLLLSKSNFSILFMAAPD